jgi:outer membrane protein insertion porin family/translocation and assembly module TamA
VTSVDVNGNDELSSKSIKKKLATRSSPKFLGLFRGVVYDYEVFDLFVLQRDLARIERYYRARGFYKARARAGRVFYDGPSRASVLIEVEEGPPTLVGKLELGGLEGVDPDAARAARDAAKERVGVGKRFEEGAYQEAEKEIRRALTDAGYAYARVTRRAEVDLPTDRARLRFDVVPYQPARYGEITIEGLGDLPERPVRAALYVEPGDEYSTSAIEDAQQAVLDLGVFSSVEIEPQLDYPPPPAYRVPLRVKLQPARLHELKLGGGLELDAIRTDVHGLVGWEHKNFLGDMRHFQIEFRPGVVLYPTRFPSFQAPTDFLPEGKLRGELRQPSFIERRMGGILRGEFNIYPVLLSSEVDPDAPVLGYREAKGSFGVDRKIRRFYGNPSYNVQQVTPFTYVGVLDDALGPLLISYLGLFLRFDFRNDPVKPHEGLFLSTNLEFAGGPFFGDAEDFKVQPEARFYVPLGDEVTLGLRGTVGLLFPQNYGRTIESNTRGERPPPGVSREEWVFDTQVNFFRAFFSGGPSSNRGYALRGIGPHGVVPFFEPNLAATQLAAQCDDPSQPDFEARCLLPLGGPTLWEASAEVRFPLTGPLSSALFCDTSDVSPTQVNFRFDRPHLSCGPGARYETPIGPIRLDIGYRIPGLQVLGDDTGEGVPPTFFGVPLAVHFGIGEAF